MKVLLLDENDKKLGLINYLDGFVETMKVPNNIFELQNDGILFYYLTGRKSKQPYIYMRGNYTKFWIATDGYLYVLDDKNNLVIGVYRNTKQKWYRSN